VYRSSRRRAMGLLVHEPPGYSDHDTEAGDHSQRGDGGPPPASSPLELPEAPPDLFVDVRGHVVGCGPGPQHGLYVGPELETALACRASRHMMLHAVGLRRLKRSIEPRMKVSMPQGTLHVGLPPLPLWFASAARVGAIPAPGPMPAGPYRIFPEAHRRAPGEGPCGRTVRVLTDASCAAGACDADGAHGWPGPIADEAAPGCWWLHPAHALGRRPCPHTPTAHRPPMASRSATTA
jgi:hypothetical protein